MSAELKMEQRHFVVLPGLDGTGKLLEPFLRNVPAPYEPRVVRYPTRDPLPYQELIPMIREVLPWNEPYVLVAESFSAPLALLYAQAQWENLEGLILASGFIRNPLPQFFNWVYPLLGKTLLAKPPPASLLKKYLLGQDDSPALLEALTEAIHAISPEVLRQRIELIMDTDATQALTECRCPILYLLGRSDALIGRRGWEAIHEARSDVRLCEFDAPHLLLQTRPTEAWTAIDKFLAELVPA